MRAEARAPRIRVLADGVEVPGLQMAGVSSNNHLAADRFHLRLAAGAGGLGALDAVDVRLDVQVSLDGGWTSLVLGEADSVSLDATRGLIEVEGRDLSALLLDARVDETFANRTSSEIAEELGGRHGLQVEADRTGTLVGRYYQSEHGRVTTGQFSKAMSEWDLLAFLAGREGFDLFVEGEVLRFGARRDGAVVTVGPGDCTSLQLDHALGMARAIEVTVRSWDQHGAEAVVRTARGGGGGRARRQAVVRPNLPAEEAQRLAERILADQVRHEWTARLAMPGELSITARHVVEIAGTGTAWDRRYAVGEVSRQVSVREGFTQHVGLQGMG